MSMMTTGRATEPKSLAAKLSNETLCKWLRDMLLIREFEVRSMQAYQNKKIGGFLHVYIGQEAVAVGTIAAVTERDPIITAYRDHANALARGTEARYCMAEMMGKVGGCAKGKGGSMHMFDRERNMFGGHGIVGAQCPLGAGLAFATKYEDEVIDGGASKRITLCYLGDGALNQGSLHEAMNLAGVLDLPVIFICENNGYSMGTATARGTTMAEDLTSKAVGYGFESASIDGMDVTAVYNDFKPVADQCRKNSRPAFVEIRTYRFKGHSMSDPRKYRTKDEEQRYEAMDPIERFAKFLIAERDVTQDQYTAMVKSVRKEVRDAISWAEKSPPPESEELYRDVYTDCWGPYSGTSGPQMHDK